ncbi:YHYH protein [Rhodopirellula bahusiensis]|uniref:Phospholipid-binding protein n=1 Tax=Rhodopirellula bahusiensis TaxID=2014065 RepID=A0A2G1WAT7_9BACT|nr:YHYH protein [Rhodopirellula bahusiensis]PHQ36155.1 phospholipid-binding protein [Rhodopirellula bahusiensis]
MTPFRTILEVNAMFINSHSLIPAIASLLCLMATTHVAAHEGGHHGHSHSSTPLRTWSIASNGSHLHGSFVSARDGKVQIRREDGTLTDIAIERLVAADQAWVQERVEEIQTLNRQHAIRLVAVNQPVQAGSENAAANETMPAIGAHFQPFEKLLQLRWDKDFLYVGSNGLPEHPMMIGIRSWQQQVPIPQKYLGNNAWQIPLHPVPAKNPMSTKNDFLRGAIALAVNGVPIFNPLNNRGDDAYLFGELDEYGGHCGRGDDYHYHIAPVHLEETTGKGQPIGYALDGYPIFGYQDAKASDFAPLDDLGGHKDASGNYHYHAQKTYPYLNGGFYGEVTQRGGQVDPQPRAEPIRPDLRPLRGAVITGFSKTGNRFELVYDVEGRQGSVTYVVKDDSTVDFTFQEPSGETRSETYRSRMGKPFLPQADSSGTEGGPGADQSSRLKVTSPAFAAGDELPLEFTGDGAGESPPIAWSKGPAGTQCYALNLWHTPGPDDVKSYWVVYDIPADVASLPQNASGIGTVGINDKGHAGYDPMKSKGPGVKQYHITVYALSEKPEFATDQVTRDELLESISDITLAEGTLDFQYTRSRSRSFLILIGIGVVALLAGAWFSLKKFTVPRVAG